MSLPLLLLALLLQAPAARQAAPKASVAGVVVHSGTGEPMANVTVSLARTDAPLGAFAEMAAVERPPFEMTLPGDFLAFLAQMMTESDQAQRKAMMSLPLDEIEAITASPDGNIAIIYKSSPPATTGSDGRFSFDNVAPGKYKLMFAAAGYARQNYGQRGGAGAPTPIVLAAGESRRDIVMRMMAVASVSGHLNDRSGWPIALVPVELIRFVYDGSGKIETQRVASAHTDDRGAYRLHYVTPGRYYLRVGEPPVGEVAENGMSPSMARLTDSAGASLNWIPRAYMLSYYPGVTDIKSAAILDVPPGAEVKDVDLTLDLQQAYWLRGHVLDPATGQPPPRADITIALRDSDQYPSLDDAFAAGGRSFRPIYNPSDGTFQLRVTTGSYTVRAANIGNLRGAANIEVAHSDVEGVALYISRPASISGTVRFEPGALSPERTFDFLKLQLRWPHGTENRSQALRETSLRNANGEFRITNVWPGEYSYVVAGLPQGYYVKSAHLGETDVLNGLLRVAGADIGPLQITIGTTAGQVDGVVADAQGHPAPGALVVLIPENGRAKTELFQSAIADPSGRFSMQSVVPGDYKLASWENAEPYAFFDPEFIRQADEHGKPVNVTESSTQTVHVTPIAAGP